MTKTPTKEKIREYNQRYYKKHTHRLRLRSLDNYYRRRKLYRTIRLEFSQKGCVHCPETHPACIDFHHRIPTQKKFEVSDWPPWHALSEQDLREELEKCDAVCSNCHRRIHWDKEEENIDKNSFLLDKGYIMWYS